MTTEAESSGASEAPITIPIGKENKATTPTKELQNIQTAYRLNGKNYLKWSQLVRTFLKGRGKLSHSLDTWPKKGDPTFETWDEEDSMEFNASYSRVRDAT